MFKEANSLTYIGYKLFGEEIRKKEDKYFELERSLKKAMISMPPEMYIATARMFSLLFGIIGAIIGLILAVILVKFVGIPPLFPVKLPEPFATYWLFYRPFVYAGILAIGITLLLYYMGNLIFTVYPATVISDRKSKIDRVLPHAITFMYSLSKGGMSLVQILRALADNHEVYGEVSREASRILWEVEGLGKDLRTALAEAVDNSPSDNFKEFIHGLITIIDSGGDITRYFEERAEFYFERARQDQKSFLEFLGLMAETYITAFVAGPLFLIIIQTVMSVMGQTNDVAIFAIIYFVIPIGSFMFAMLIKLLTPGEEGSAPKLRERFVYIRRSGELDEEEVKKIKKKVNRYKLKKRLKNPFAVIRDNPYYTFAFSIPAAVIMVTYGILVNPYIPGMDVKNWFFTIDDYIFISLMIILAPFAFFYEWGRRGIKTYMRLTPIFLSKLASANESGMPIYRAISMIAKTDTSPLKKEIAKIKADLDWGISLSDALVRFANRLKIFEISRTMTLLNEALKSTGNVTEVLMISAKDATGAELLRRERLTNMFMYVVIVYIAFFVFIGIVYVISSTFLSTLAESAAKVQATGQSFTMLQSVDVNLYRNVFLHAAVFQGIFAGMVAGVMGEGSLSSGAKHSFIMLVIAYVGFSILFGFKLM
ncbi:type II secretion system F family protein [Archaeoglobus neptunius]|uniref:type II secretion system F family protein n=1 Tax=Archaeoglobus neptunius TaxID=2798580 RepID=UPI001926C564|nr:type II secretion system F family protein [Archaeoglobus neptunius]